MLKKCAGAEWDAVSNLSSPWDEGSACFEVQPVPVSRHSPTLCFAIQFSCLRTFGLSDLDFARKSQATLAPISLLYSAPPPRVTLAGGLQGASALEQGRLCSLRAQCPC